MGMKHIAWAREHSRAQGAARMVIFVLASAADDEDNTCFPGIETLIRWANCGRSSVFRAIQEIEELGEVECKRRPGKATIYTLPMPEGVSLRYPSQNDTGVNVGRVSKRHGSQDDTKGVSSWDKRGVNVGPIKSFKASKEKPDLFPFAGSAVSAPKATAQSDAEYKQQTAAWVDPTPAENAARNEAIALWEAVKKDLQLQLPGNTFDNYVRQAQAVTYDGATLTITGASIFAVDYLQGRLTPMIERTLAAHVKHAVTLEVIEVKDASD